MGSFAGRCPQHAVNVALELNLNTGYVIPQFHLVIDDYFETVEDFRSGMFTTW